MTREAGEKKRYNLVIPTELYAELETIATKRQVKVVDVLRGYIELGLWFDTTMNKPDTSLLIKEGGKERELVFFNSLVNTGAR